jgi:hypothetical protein
MFRFFYTLYLLSAYGRSFPQVWSSKADPRLTVSRAIPLLPIFVFVACFAICLTLYLTENCVESLLQLEMESTDRPENCVQVNMLEPKREESGKLHEHGDELAGSLNCSEVLYKLKNCWVLKEDSAV